MQLNRFLQAHARENTFSTSRVKQYPCIHKYYLAQWALGINSNCVSRCSQKHPFKYDINSIFSQHRFCCQLISACCLLTTQLSLNTNETHLPLPAQSHNLPTLQAIVNSSVPTFCLQCTDCDDSTEKTQLFCLCFIMIVTMFTCRPRLWIYKWNLNIGNDWLMKWFSC